MRHIFAKPPVKVKIKGAIRNIKSGEATGPENNQWNFQKHLEIGI